MGASSELEETAGHCNHEPDCGEMGKGLGLLVLLVQEKSLGLLTS